MDEFNYQSIKNKVRELAKKITAPDELLPDYGKSREFAYPHIEIEILGLLHFVVVERGQELQRRTTNELDELLYWIFSGITFSMACDFELNNRRTDEDFRRVMFKKQEELLSKISKHWAQLEAASHSRILSDYPYQDN